jgi:uncharacterized protein YkwD
VDGSRRRAALLLAIGLAFAGGTTAAVVRSASAASGAPRVTASKVNDDIRVSWTFAARPNRFALELMIDRRTSSSSWAKIGTVEDPTTQGSKIDTAPKPGTSYYRARLYEKRVLIGTSPSVRVVRATPPTTAPPTTTTTTVAPSGGVCATARADVLQLVNEERADADRDPLVAHAQLDASAQVHSNEMARVQDLSHDNWIEEIRAAGYTRGTIGQNAAVGYPTSAAVMQGWMNSTGHRNNILSASYDEIGIGCARDGNGTYWWTQNFGG